MSLGVIAGMLTFIPFFGALAAGVLAIVFASTQGPQQALYVAILAIAIQQIEGHVLTPLVQRWAAQLPPVLSIMSSVVFGLLFVYLVYKGSGIAQSFSFKPRRA